jgi:putative MFS transporter
MAHASPTPETSRFAGLFCLPILVCAFGYFVDVYDIWVFASTRNASLRDLGYSGDQLFDMGVYLLNMQMGGLFLGGLIFGVLGDKIGRTKMMFASILTYSAATFLNAFVGDIHSYAALRFIAGMGLAGELGLAITLIGEILPTEKRGYGTGIVVGCGVLGAAAAGGLAHFLSWQNCYIVGGLFGFVLLAFRLRVAESSLFLENRHDKTRGRLSMLFTSPRRIMRFIQCVALITPIWFVAGILITFSTDIAQSRGDAVIATATMLMWFNLVMAGGDFISAWISQFTGSRRKVIMACTSLSALMTGVVLLWPQPMNETGVMLSYCLLGAGCGVWVLAITVAAESFGTNLRATVTTAVPNFARAMTIPMTLCVSALKPVLGLSHAAMAVGAVIFVAAFWAVMRLPETVNQSMDFREE